MFSNFASRYPQPVYGQVQWCFGGVENWKLPAEKWKTIPKAKIATKQHRAICAIPTQVPIKREK